MDFLSFWARLSLPPLPFFLLPPLSRLPPFVLFPRSSSLLPDSSAGGEIRVIAAAMITCAQPYVRWEFGTDYDNKYYFVQEPQILLLVLTKILLTKILLCSTTTNTTTTTTHREEDADRHDEEQREDALGLGLGIG